MDKILSGGSGMQSDNPLEPQAPNPGDSGKTEGGIASPQDLNQQYAGIAPSVLAWGELRIPRRLRRHLAPEDLVQEVWMRALGSHSSFDPARGSLRAWVFGFARNILLEVLKSPQSRHATLGMPQLGAVFDFDALSGEISSITGKALRNEKVKAFIAAGQLLSDEDRELLVLRGLEGRGHDEVANTLGLTAGQCRKRWERLRARLLDAMPESTIVEEG